MRDIIQAYVLTHILILLQVLPDRNVLFGCRAVDRSVLIFIVFRKIANISRFDICYQFNKAINSDVSDLRQTFVERQNNYVAELFSYPSGLISVSFQNAPIREIAQIILGEKLQTPYAIHPGVSGILMLNTSALIMAKNLLFILEAALLDHDTKKSRPSQCALP